MTPQSIIAHVESRLSGFRATDDPQPLSGGLINFVWRLRGEPQSVIVKYAAPYIAVLPDIPLDPQRLLFEARSLQLFEKDGALATLAQPAFRPPRLLDFDPLRSLIILEDAGAAPDLGQWLIDGMPADYDGPSIGAHMGHFFGRLHGQSYLTPALEKSLNNVSIQQARLSGQYSDALTYLKRGNVPDAEALGRRAYEFGLRLQEPGICLIMGDLWPPSTLFSENGLRLIDWEFSHYGLPAQDVGHLAAHLWMHAHRASSPAHANRSQTLLTSFLASYRHALGDRFQDVFGAASLQQSALHFGCELLARAIGNYQSGYLYDGLAPDSIAVREAVQVAAEHIREPDAAEIFVPLAT